MGEACYCDFGGGESPEWCDSRMRKARKEHTCCECKEPIRRGESYELFVGKWDGNFDTFKTCEHCKGLRDELKRSLQVDDYSFGDLACLFALWLHEGGEGRA